MSDAVKSVTLTGFLLARLAEERAAERDRWILQGIPEGKREAARSALSRTTAYQLDVLTGELVGLGWACVAIFWRPAVKRRAARYAWHPDYDPAWTPT